MYSELEQYFENIAKNHISINHTATNKHFFRIDVEEVLTRITTKVNYPFLSLERAEFMLAGPNNDNVSQQRTVALMYIDKYAEGDYDAINTIYDLSEKVAQDIVNRLLYDMETGVQPSILRGFNVNTVNVQHLPLHPTNNHTGVRITLTLDSKYNRTIDKSKWKDL
ncbi:MAG: hypothetical protein A2X13_14770 [Bacteroidetes bacterium GWC2_33_15]|nr:MAG: hypothetical protein A2X10_06835 [Bacteroidetes bacterium GWA2_33_15]OFX50136.1 MAG: hypothetical protein A2X13_14770 [Bacteroidetes bacterium GWC2_33_15]OFX65289.1 MAG: hypothetical protein A2X15_04345 [Bacteroidetes bacterium GWB2_32_14]OFX70515.1 MAG: hypothetical protein A2X14_04400 [Bacteroidetes bacterium GWD2_33_33]HAN19612.1 hypothetical protein [Bacteroidales bacterium]